MADVSPMSGQLSLGIQLRDNASFGNYHPGGNREVMQAIRRSATGEGEQFIYLWGRSGIGKTHLLQAACRAAAARGAGCAYLPLRQFGEIPLAILDGLEDLGLVCVDDIQCVAGYKDWETALFHLYNRLRDGGAHLIISADAAPAAVGIALPDLASRLAWGLVLQLMPLDDYSKRVALQLRARARGFELPDSVARYLLRRSPRDMPALFELLDRLDQASLAAQRKLTIPFVKKVAGFDE